MPEMRKTARQGTVKRHSPHWLCEWGDVLKRAFATAASPGDLPVTASERSPPRLAGADMRESPSVGRFQVAAQVAAALVAAVVVLVVILSVLVHDMRAGFDGVLLFVIGVVTGVGYVVARKQSANPIGWILLASAALFSVYTLGVLYTVLDFHQHGGRLPLGRAALATQPSWSLGVVLLGLAVAIFPDGKVGSRAWRVVVGVYLAAGVWFAVVWSISQAALHIGPRFDVDAVGNYLGVQHGFPGMTASVAWAATPLVAVLFVAFVVRQWVTWRRATGERRKQLTWLMSGGAVSILSIVVIVNTNVSGSLRVVTDVVGLGLAAIPLAIGIGILRYRLYEIDRLISRTISYTILTGLLAGVFLSIVLLATRVLPFSSPVAVAASTLAAAALFNPLRRKIQHTVDHHFNRSRYDHDAIVADFRTQLRTATDLNTVRATLETTVDGSVQPAHLTVWLRQVRAPKA